MLEHMENIWEKMQGYFSRWKRGGGGGGASFSLLTLSDLVCGAGGAGEFSVSFGEIFSSQGCMESCCFERNNIDCPSVIPDLLQSEL